MNIMLINRAIMHVFTVAGIMHLFLMQMILYGSHTPADIQKFTGNNKELGHWVCYKKGNAIYTKTSTGLLLGNMQGIVPGYKSPFSPLPEVFDSIEAEYKKQFSEQVPGGSMIPDPKGGWMAAYPSKK